MGGVDQPGAVRDLVDFLDEDRPFALELVDHVSVVDDLLAHVDGPVADLEGLLDDVDRADHARAEAAQASHQERFDLRKRFGHQVTVSTSFSSSVLPRALAPPAFEASSG